MSETVLACISMAIGVLIGVGWFCVAFRKRDNQSSVVVKTFAESFRLTSSDFDPANDVLVFYYPGALSGNARQILTKSIQENLPKGSKGLILEEGMQLAVLRNGKRWSTLGDGLDPKTS